MHVCAVFEMRIDSCCLNGHWVSGPLFHSFSAFSAVCIAAVPYHRLLHHALLYPVNAHCSNNTHPSAPSPQTNSTTHRHRHSPLHSDSQETEHLACPYNKHTCTPAMLNAPNDHPIKYIQYIHIVCLCAWMHLLVPLLLCTIICVALQTSGLSNTCCICSLTAQTIQCICWSWLNLPSADRCKQITASDVKLAGASLCPYAPIFS